MQCDRVSDGFLSGWPGRFEVRLAVEFPPRADGGGRTFELVLAPVVPAATSAYVLGRRGAGTVSGRHYHRGLSASKDPEVFLLLTGRATWRVADLAPLLAADEAVAAGDSLDMPPMPPVTGFDIEGPCTVLIYPKVWHELVAHTPIEFVELNSIADHAADTFTDWEPAD